MRKSKLIERRSFGKIPTVLEMPDLLDIQVSSYEDFLQADVPPQDRKPQGLQAVFHSIFPITDVHNVYSLEFVEYAIGTPKYDVWECRERDATFAAPLRATLRLITRDPQDKSGEVKDVLEQAVFLGELPLMTEQGTFIINGSERVIVSQLHRSPGVFFDETTHPNGKKLYSARVIPYRGSWVEFSIDINDSLYVHIERKRKLPVTVLLRAIGFSTNREIVEAFCSTEEAPVTDSLIGRTCFESVADKDSGEVFIDELEVFTEEHVRALQQHGVKRVRLVTSDYAATAIENTLKRDPSGNRDEALYRIYTLLRPGDPPNVETAHALLNRLFFNPKKYDLGDVGRYMMNQRLDLDVGLETSVLTVDDFVAIMRYLLELAGGNGYTDDIDHLGNRRCRSVGELLSNQFSIGLSRMARTIRERMSLRDSETLTPQELVNARTVSTVVNSFFGSSQLSQFLQQTNPLDELTHKRRLSALGPGGLTRDRAGFEVRDVHYSHYGRICPIETPEGPNIGLIASLSTYARVNKYGFLETPYRVVKNGKVTEKIVYLTADQEDRYIIAQANEPLDGKGRFVRPLVSTRLRDNYPMVSPEEVDYMDVSPKQLVSAAAALIPFLEHDDANRALMGSNMQRQAVPLLVTEPALVGTGMEHKVALDSGAMALARASGEVAKVTADRIQVKTDERPSPSAGDVDMSGVQTCLLTKFSISNQECCIDQRPLVKVGDRVEPGRVLADGPCTSRGELALGRNVLVAFMPWLGSNFEDAIVVSERLVKEDVFTSIHIEEFELQVRDTKRGAEEITREIPNVSEQAVRNLDENGIIRLGAEVGPGDILVGKVTPKGETELSPEERLLRAIFGEKAGDVRDASLKAPPGMDGVVIRRRVFSRKERDEKTRKIDRQQITELRKQAAQRIEKTKASRDAQIRKLLTGTTAGTMRNEDDHVVVRKGRILKEELLARLDLDAVHPDEYWCTDSDVNEQVRELLDTADQILMGINEELQQEIDKVSRGDELPPGVVQLVKVYVARKRKLSVGDKMAGRHGNKGVVAKIVPDEDVPYLPDGTPVDIVLNPVGVPARMNLGQIMETHLGWAARKLGIYVSSPVFDGATLDEVKATLREAGLPESGKTALYDGLTGELFDKEVTVGYIYMMKLSHLVDDKIHARSIGPYSLVTQQPLGGKAQFGGQRFGEMEVWALEAYGGAYLLQEMLTVKSDDVIGRSKVYEAIVKGENPPDPGIPESFNVLVKELQSLGLDIRLEKSSEFD